MGESRREDRRRAVGRRGEQLAAAYLRRRGCEVLARNVRTRHGEIDVIARDGRALVFVEVKTRMLGARRRAIAVDQLPLAGLGARQRARLRRLAAAWLRDAPAGAHGSGTASGGARASYASIRFDAIGVVLDSHGRVRRLDHVRDAW